MVQLLGCITDSSHLPATVFETEWDRCHHLHYPRIFFGEGVISDSASNHAARLVEQMKLPARNSESASEFLVLDDLRLGM